MGGKCLTSAAMTGDTEPLVPTIVVLMVKTFVLGKEGILDSGFLTAFKSFLLAMRRTGYNILIDINIY